MKKLKNSNKGFTLIELIIATAVLTVIMTPLMRAFVIASNTSRQTNVYGETSTAIKNTVELINAAAMSGINDLTGIESNLGNLPAYDSTVLEVKPMEAADLVSYHTASQGFVINNADMGNGAGKLDVVITPIDSSETDTNSYAYNEWYKDVNSTDFSSFTNMDVTMLQPGVKVESDGVNITKSIEESTHADYRATSFLRTGITAHNRIDRNVQITLTESDLSTAEKPLLTYEVKYIYTVDSSNTWSVTVFTGDAGYGDDGVCSIQIAYYPFYGSTGLTTPIVVNDRFTINNQKDLPVKLFLIKQDMSGFPLAVNSVETIGDSHEMGYNCSIYVEETAGTVTNPITRLYTNMNLNVISSNPMNGTFKYFYNGVEAGDSFKDRLVADDTGGRAFNVHVVAYQKNAANTYVEVDRLLTVKLI